MPQGVGVGAERIDWVQECQIEQINDLDMEVAFLVDYLQGLPDEVFWLVKTMWEVGQPSPKTQ